MKHQFNFQNDLPKEKKEFKPKLDKSLKKEIKVVAIVFLIISVLYFIGTKLHRDEQTNLELQNAIQNYVNQNSNVPIIRNMQVLLEANNLFKGKLMDNQWDLVGRIQVDKSTNTVKFQPFKTDTLKSDLFLISPFRINDYALVFSFDKELKNIQQVKAKINYGGGEQELSQNDLTDLTKYLKTSRIADQKKIVEEDTRLAQEEKETKAKTEKFTADCISGYDGSCRTLVALVKQNLKDPASFEHIETTFWCQEKYSIVSMKYRARNEFGGFVVEVVKAKISYQCEVIEILETYSL